MHVAWRRIGLSVQCALLLIGLAAAAAGQSAVKSSGVVYRIVDDKKLLMDVAQPLPLGVQKAAVVFLCGNGWGYSDTTDRTEFAYGLNLANARGFVGVTVDYSSSRPNSKGRPIGSFPAQLYDVKSAIRFLRANARRFDIDPERIAVVGHSSGGNLALMLGLTRRSDGLEGTDPYSGYSSAVQAVVNFAGPTDLASDYAATPEVDAAYIGGTPIELPDEYRQASPVTYARADAAPILTIQGDEDVATLPRQAILLDERMRAVGGSHTLIIRKGAGHMDFSLADPAVWVFLTDKLRDKS